MSVCRNHVILMVSLVPTICVAAPPPTAGTRALLTANPGLRATIQDGRLVALYGRSFADRDQEPSTRAFVDGFLANNADALGADGAQFQFRYEIALRGDKFKVFAYTQTMDGLEVHGSVVKVRVLQAAGTESDKIVYAGMRLFQPPDPPLPSQNEISDTAALAVAAAAHGHLTYPDLQDPEQAEWIMKVVYLAPDDTLHRAWRFSGWDMDEAWRFFVGTTSSEIVGIEDAIHRSGVQGQVKGWRTPDTAADALPLEVEVMPGVEVRLVPKDGDPTTCLEFDEATDYIKMTDASGGYDFSPNGTTSDAVAASLTGEWVTVWDCRGVECVDTAGGVITQPAKPIACREVQLPLESQPELVFNDGGMELDTAAVNAFLVGEETHDWFKDLFDPSEEFDLIDDHVVPIIVNNGPGCAPEYTNFATDEHLIRMRKSHDKGIEYGCENSAFSSLLSHEYGHFITSQVVGPFIPAGNPFMEAMSQTIASLKWDTSCIAENFRYKASGDLLRCDYNVECSEPGRTFCPDSYLCDTNPGPCVNDRFGVVSANDSYGVANVIAGAFWDLRKELMYCTDVDESCSTDGDCDWNEDCIESKCRCDADTDCDPGRECLSGTCRMPCADYGPCVHDMYCTGGDEPCSEEAPCATGTSCIESKCRCRMDAQCSDGRECISDTCRTPCADYGPCVDDQCPGSAPGTAACGEDDRCVDPLCGTGESCVASECPFWAPPSAACDENDRCVDPVCSTNESCSDRLTEELFADFMTISIGDYGESILIDVLVADDDNGDLSDGTPNCSAILCAFVGEPTTTNPDPCQPLPGVTGCEVEDDCRAQGSEPLLGHGFACPSMVVDLDGDGSVKVTWAGVPGTPQAGVDYDVHYETNLPTVILKTTEVEIEPGSFAPVTRWFLSRYFDGKCEGSQDPVILCNGDEDCPGTTCESFTVCVLGENAGKECNDVEFCGYAPCEPYFQPLNLGTVTADWSVDTASDITIEIGTIDDEPCRGVQIVDIPAESSALSPPDETTWSDVQLKLTRDQSRCSDSEPGSSCNTQVCPEGQVCVGAQCYKTCIWDSDCPTGTCLNATVLGLGGNLAGRVQCYADENGVGGRISGEVQGIASRVYGGSIGDAALPSFEAAELTLAKIDQLPSGHSIAADVVRSRPGLSGGVTINGPLYGSIEVAGDLEGAVKVYGDGGVNSAINVTGNLEGAGYPLSDPVAVYFKEDMSGEYGDMHGDIQVGGDIVGRVQIDGDMNGNILVTGEILGTLQVDGEFDGDICAANVRPDLPLPSNVVIASFGPNATVCGWPNEWCTLATDCDDGNDCTDDTCVGSGCQFIDNLTCTVARPSPAGYPHNAPKNRYISFNPINPFYGQDIAFKVELKSITLGSCDDATGGEEDFCRADRGAGDCNACSGSGDSCISASIDCSPGASCDPTGATCLNNLPNSGGSNIGQEWWLGPQHPSQNGVHLLVSETFRKEFNDWLNPTHAGDCEIVPQASYGVRAVKTATGEVSDELLIETTQFPPVTPPAPFWWGDCVGNLLVQGVWTPPNGSVNFDDVSAALWTSTPVQGVTVSADFTWVDVHGNDSFTQGSQAFDPPNNKINASDLQQIGSAFGGLPYKFYDPADCPDVAEWPDSNDLTGPPSGSPSFVLVPNDDLLDPAQDLQVEVYISEATNVFGYEFALEVTGGSAGSLSLIDVSVDAQRTDYLFNGITNLYKGNDLAHERYMALLDTAGAGVTKSGQTYLGTFTYQPVGGASGVFTISVKGDLDSFLLKPDGSTQRTETDACAVVGYGIDCLNNDHCDDNNDCTDDACTSYECGYTNVTSGTTCDDGLWCTNKGSTCDGNGNCTGGNPRCQPGEICDEQAQLCIGAPPP